MINILRDIESKKLDEIEEIIRKEKFGETLIRDGIINADIWKDTPDKIKYVLKEVNDTKDYHIADLFNSALSNEEYNEKVIKDLRPTWLNIARWTKGLNSLFNNDNNINWKDIDSNSKWYNKNWLYELQKISVINIKKTPGAGEAIDSELIKAIRLYGDLIWEQIMQSAPKIVIFCGTGDFFSSKTMWDGKQPIKKWEITNKGFEYYKYTKNSVLIKYWHPNAHFPHNMMYYSLMDIVSELKN